MMHPISDKHLKAFEKCEQYAQWYRCDGAKTYILPGAPPEVVETFDNYQNEQAKWKCYEI